MGIGLHYPKNNPNVGSVLRLAGNFNAAFVATTGKRYYVSSADTMKAYRHLPLFNVPNLKDVIPYDCIPVAVEINDNATNIVEYEHPKRAFYIFGPEDGSLNKEILGYCKDTIYVPTNRCLNLASCVGIVMYDRLMKGIKNEQS